MSAEDDLQDEEFYSTLIPVNEQQMACIGSELIDLFNFSDEIDDADEDYFVRLGLTCTVEYDEMCDCDIRSFRELSDEAYYLLTFTPDTDLSDFSMLDLLAIEEIPEQTYIDFADAAETSPCDGDCDNCLQNCIGKQPIE